MLGLLDGSGLSGRRRAASQRSVRDSIIDYMSDHQEPSQELKAASVESVREALRQVKDPELGFNIVDLGLVYTIDITDGDVLVEMTLTSPGCPVGGQLLGEADAVVREVNGVKNVRVELVWEPFWTPERIDPKVRAYLGF